jgi:hypothetical protein
MKNTTVARRSITRSKTSLAIQETCHMALLSFAKRPEMEGLERNAEFKKFIRRNWKTLSDRSLKVTKSIYQLIEIRKTGNRKTILFIFGCQRSGTTLLTEIFERDFDNTKVYGEFSHLSSHDKKHHIRLNPLHLVKAQIDNSRPSLVILKPIVESQNALKLLDYFQNSKVLWVYRHYKGVSLSHIEKWGV